MQNIDCDFQVIFYGRNISIQFEIAHTKLLFAFTKKKLLILSYVKDENENL